MAIQTSMQRRENTLWSHHCLKKKKIFPSEGRCGSCEGQTLWEAVCSQTHAVSNKQKWSFKGDDIFTVNGSNSSDSDLNSADEQLWQPRCEHLKLQTGNKEQ